MVVVVVVPGGGDANPELGAAEVSPAVGEGAAAVGSTLRSPVVGAPAPTTWSLALIAGGASADDMFIGGTKEMGWSKAVSLG